ncbi:MAG: ferrous iron transport protein B [Flavobacteriales bacterium]|nr:ferrous iron transport protein B [Flavobacteriales bacterium]
MPEKLRTYALTGAPNSGKSSIFNRLTGLRQKVGNYPGVTVDKHSAIITIGEEKVELIDLPGCYSLYPSSDDERVVLDTLTKTDSNPSPDLIIHVISANNLMRSMLLLSQLIDLDYPVVSILNMVDMADTAGIKVDIPLLEKRMGVELIPVNGRTGMGLDSLLETLAKEDIGKGRVLVSDNVYRTELTEALREKLNLRSNYSSYLLACQHGKSGRLSQEEFKLLPDSELFNNIRAEVRDKQERIQKLEARLPGVVSQSSDGKISLSDKVDRVLTHSIWGSVIFLVVLFILFQSIFTWATPLMEMVDESMLQLTNSTRNALPSGFLTDLLCDGILAGLGGIVIFIPQIAILFGLVAILEESGYMTRAVYLSDKIMRRSGLNGRSLVSLISGVACAVPAIMATRTIGNWKERMITIFVTPFMSCSARLPVYIVLIAFVVPEQRFLGVISLQGLLMFGLYLLGAVAAVTTAYFMKKILKSNESSFLMMELPDYQYPQWRNVLIMMYEKSKVFVFEAGKIILIISIILWVLASYGPTKDMEAAAIKADEQLEQGLIAESEYEDKLASYKLESSYVGHLGKAIEPAIEPLGFDWKMGIALITSFAAREVFVGTMATIYSTGSSEEEQTIIERMRSERNTDTGELVYTPLRSLSLLLFYVFAMQCMSTLAIVKRETKSWAIPIAQFVFMTGVAYLTSLFVWQVF